MTENKNDDGTLRSGVLIFYRKFKLLLWIAAVLFGIWIFIDWGSNLWQKVWFIFNSILERDLEFALKFQAIFTGTLLIFAWIGIMLVFFTLIGFFLTTWYQQLQIQDSRMAFQKQLFESNLFRMLDAHEKLSAEITHVDDHRQEYRGQDCLEKLYGQFYRQWQESAFTSQPLSKDDLALAVAESSIIFYDGNKNLSQLLAVVYFIVKMIDEAPELMPEDRELYLSFLLARLTPKQLAHIFYFAIPATRSKFKYLIEKYAILRDFHANLLFSTDHGALYADSAYQREKEYLWW
ncbi:MAG: putative phage abortive infection protein [Verrucomicrobiota bacterium]